MYSTLGSQRLHSIYTMCRRFCQIHKANFAYFANIRLCKSIKTDQNFSTVDKTEKTAYNIDTKGTAISGYSKFGYFKKHRKWGSWRCFLIFMFRLFYKPLLFKNQVTKRDKLCQHYRESDEQFKSNHCLSPPLRE